MAAKKSTSKGPAKKSAGAKPMAKPGAKKTAKKGKALEPKPIKKSPGRGTSARARGVTVADYFATLPPEQLAIAKKLEQLVGKSAPGAKAELKWGQPVWELNGPLAFMRGSRHHLTFGFWRGAELEDPSKILEGDGTKMRHVKILSMEKMNAPAIAAILAQAAALNLDKGDPTAR